MSTRSTFVLAVALALCACSQSVSVMQTPPTINKTPATAAIDFGTVPLWREADTTYTLHLNRLDSITSIAFSDSDFTLLNAPLSVHKQDSTLTLNIRYQPELIANHAGNLLLLAGKDTLGIVSLTGGTSPFERHVGDSYVYDCLRDGRYSLDSIAIINMDSAKQPFFVSGNGAIDSGLKHTTINTRGDFLMAFYPAPCLDLYLKLPIATDSNWNSSGVDSFFIGHYFWGFQSVMIGDSMTQLNSSRVPVKTFEVANYLDVYNGTRTGYLSQEYDDSMTFYYAPDLHCFTSMNIERRTSGAAINTADLSESYHLLRFHLRR